MAHDARGIANAILDAAERDGRSLDHISLQKILFLLHAWWLSHKGEPLVAQAFEAWEYGPVSRIVYDSFKSCKDSPVGPLRATRTDPFTEAVDRVPANLSAEEHDFLVRCVRYYSSYSAFELVRLTHAPNGPWDLVFRQHRGPDAIIDNTLIRRAFRDMIKNCS